MELTATPKEPFLRLAKLFYRQSGIGNTIIGITYAAIVIEFLVSIYAAVMIIRLNKKLG